MGDEFKSSIYWKQFADMVAFMRECYPVDSKDLDYPAKVAERYFSYCEKYKDDPGVTFFCRMMSYIVYELQRIYNEG